MRYRHRGFIFLVGTKNVVSVDRAAAVPRTAPCPKCGRTGTLAGQVVRPWFTFFLIPLFPIGSGRPFTKCRGCGAAFTASPRQFAQAAAVGETRQSQRAITLYNVLRASPANSVRLNELMNLYLSMGDPAQAISTAAAFPAAVDASEQCMVTLGRAHLAAGDTGAAVAWFDRSTARTPDLGDGYYYKAEALLDRDRPDPVGAVAAARLARTAGHPRADDLLRRAEAAVREGEDR